MNLTRPSPQPSPEPVEPDFAQHQSSGTFSGTLSNLTWLCTKATQTFSGNLLRNPVEPDLVLHQSFLEPDLALRQSFPDLLRNFRLNLTQRLHHCTPELFWAEDPVSLRCWGKGTTPLGFIASKQLSKRKETGTTPLGFIAFNLA